MKNGEGCSSGVRFLGSSNREACERTLRNDECIFLEARSGEPGAALLGKAVPKALTNLPRLQLDIGRSNSCVQ